MIHTCKVHDMNWFYKHCELNVSGTVEYYSIPNLDGYFVSDNMWDYAGK